MKYLKPQKIHCLVEKMTQEETSITESHSLLQPTISYTFHNIIFLPILNKVLIHVLEAIRHNFK